MKKYNVKWKSNSRVVDSKKEALQLAAYVLNHEVYVEIEIISRHYFIPKDRVNL